MYVVACVFRFRLVLGNCMSVFVFVSVSVSVSVCMYVYVYVDLCVFV